MLKFKGNNKKTVIFYSFGYISVSYTHLRAHETVLDLVCRLLLEKKKNIKNNGAFWGHLDYNIDQHI